MKSIPEAFDVTEADLKELECFIIDKASALVQKFKRDIFKYKLIKSHKYKNQFVMEYMGRLVAYMSAMVVTEIHHYTEGEDIKDLLNSLLNLIQNKTEMFEQADTALKEKNRNIH